MDNSTSMYSSYLKDIILPTVDHHHLSRQLPVSLVCVVRITTLPPPIVAIFRCSCRCTWCVLSRLSSCYTWPISFFSQAPFHDCQAAVTDRCRLSLQLPVYLVRTVATIILLHLTNLIFQSGTFSWLSGRCNRSSLSFAAAANVLGAYCHDYHLATLDQSRLSAGRLFMTVRPL